MSALGPQGAHALCREPVLYRNPLYKQAEHGPELFVPQAPTVQALPTGWQRPEVFAAQEVADLRERVRDLEVEVAHLTRQLDAAWEAGRRDEREVKARTMGGQVLSIFVGSGR